MLRDGGGISDATPNSAIFSLHEMIASLQGTFTLVTQQPFGVMSCSQGKFHTLGVALCWDCPIFIANTECKIGLVYHLAVERRRDDI